MQELCKALKVLGGFVCEFQELDSPIRRLRDAVRPSFCIVSVTLYLPNGLIGRRSTRKRHFI